MDLEFLQKREERAVVNGRLIELRAEYKRLWHQGKEIDRLKKLNAEKSLELEKERQEIEDWLLGCEFRNGSNAV